MWAEEEQIIMVYYFLLLSPQKSDNDLSFPRAVLRKNPALLKFGAHKRPDACKQHVVDTSGLDAGRNVKNKSDLLWSYSCHQRNRAAT